MYRSTGRQRRQRRSAGARYHRYGEAWCGPASAARSRHTSELGFTSSPCSGDRPPPPSPWLFSSESEHESELPFFPPLCVFTCLARWSDLMNLLLHTGHANLFSPVCVRRCRCSSSERVNRLPQNNQLHTNGRSPVCQRRWAFRWDVLP